MAAPHDAPSASELIESVREWLERDVIDASEGRLKFHARVAANVLAIVERELLLGPLQAQNHHDRLDRFGFIDDAALAACLRHGDFDGDAAELRAMLRESVEDKLRVANPRYLD